MRSALLVMDVQVARLQRFGTPELVAALKRAIAEARRQEVLVVFVRLGFRERHPEVSPDNKLFAAIAAAGSNLDSDGGAAFDLELAPVAGDIVVTKRRVSAFTGSDLAQALRGQRVTDLVLAGIATSGVVLSTLTEAADLDYRIAVLSDACVDADPELHRVLIEKYFPRMAEVLTVEEWARQLGEI